jgi:hypothetical protein
MFDILITVLIIAFTLLPNRVNNMSEKEAEKDLLDASLTVRLSSSSLNALNKIAEQCGESTSDLVREMVDALCKGKLKIIVPKSQLRMIKGVHVHAGTIS